VTLGLGCLDGALSTGNHHCELLWRPSGTEEINSLFRFELAFLSSEKVET
jgi:hypothetical protein